MPRIKSVQNRREELRRKSRDTDGKHGPAEIANGSSPKNAGPRPRAHAQRSLTSAEPAESSVRQTRPCRKNSPRQACAATGRSVAFYFFRLPCIADHSPARGALVLPSSSSSRFRPTDDHPLHASPSVLGLLGYYAAQLYISTNLPQPNVSNPSSRPFPDALDLLLICVESGMSVEAAFHKVASEIG